MNKDIKDYVITLAIFVLCAFIVFFVIYPITLAVLLATLVICFIGLTTFAIVKGYLK